MSNKKSEGTFTPKLRFPEFRNAPEWERKKLSELLFETKQRNRNLKYSPKDVLSVSGEYGVVNQIDLLGRSYAGVSVKDYHIVETGDIVYTKSPLKKNPFGIIKENKGKPGIVSTLYAVYRATDKAYSTYLDHYFSRDYNLNSYLQPIVRKGAKNDMKVNNFAVLGGEILIPRVDEQQKIADCLTSLDELIAAERAQLDALKAYKKGLLQNLFPAEGETVPALRFPEFQSAGEWEEKTLGDLGTLILGLTYSPSDIRDKGLLVLRSSNIRDGVIVLDDCVYVTPDVRRANLSKPNDILICVRNGSTALIGKNAIIPEGMPLCTHGAFMTVFRAENPKFAYQLLQTKAYQSQVAAGLGARINSINNSQLLNYTFFVPPLPEQQKIAELFASIDEEIAGQGQRLAALGVHKQGLLQGLFPVPEKT